MWATELKGPDEPGEAAQDGEVPSPLFRQEALLAT
jgi:hypothetical protein